MRTRIAVGIPTVGRASILCETLRELTLQTRPADSVIVCGSEPADVEGAAELSSGARLLMAEPGLPRQRNAVIAAATDADILVFFDDDFLPDAGYLAAVEQAMTATPDIVVATGLVLADGIIGPGLAPETGRAILAGHVASADRRQGQILRLWLQYGGSFGADAPAWPLVRRTTAAVWLARGRRYLASSCRFWQRSSRSRPREASTWASNPGVARASASAIRRSPIRFTFTESKLAIHCRGRWSILDATSR